MYERNLYILVRHNHIMKAIQILEVFKSDILEQVKEVKSSNEGILRREITIRVADIMYKYKCSDTIARRVLEMAEKVFRTELGLNATYEKGELKIVIEK